MPEGCVTADIEIVPAGDWAAANVIDFREYGPEPPVTSAPEPSSPGSVVWRAR